MKWDSYELVLSVSAIEGVWSVWHHHLVSKSSRSNSPGTKAIWPEKYFKLVFFSTCRLGCRRTHCKPECAPSRCPSWRKELPHKQRADKGEPEQKSFWHFEFRFPVLCWWWNHKREVSWSCLQPKRSARLLLLINGDILYISFDYNMGNQPLISDETFQTQNGKILTMISKGDGMSIVLMTGSKTENAFSFFLNCSSFWTETISKGAITFHECTAQLPVWVKIPMEILRRSGLGEDTRARGKPGWRRIQQKRITESKNYQIYLWIWIFVFCAHFP